MARAKTNKLYRTFVKGLITEASPLTYPEDASIDELNTIISRKGNRTRRTGVEYQSGYVFNDLGISGTKIVNEFVWLSAKNNPLFNFLVVQVGSTIYFYKFGDGPLSANKHAFSFDLSTYKIEGVNLSDLVTEPAAFSAGAGFLFIAHRFCDPVSVSYDDILNTFEPVRVLIQIRDFEGVNDGLPNDAEPTVLSKEHLYNLRNQGWINSGSSSTAGSSVVGTGGSFPFSGADNPFGLAGGYQSVVYFDSFTGEWIGYDVNGDLARVFHQDEVIS